MTTPTKVALKTQSRTLTLSFKDRDSVSLDFEYLRVYSPSAEVRGHGNSGGSLPFGKREVVLTTLEPVGHYGVKLIFNDGHDSGIYTWEYLLQLAADYDRKWPQYLQALAAQGLSRDAGVQVLKL